MRVLIVKSFCRNILISSSLSSPPPSLLSSSTSTPSPTSSSCSSSSKQTLFPHYNSTFSTIMFVIITTFTGDRRLPTSWCIPVHTSWWNSSWISCINPTPVSPYNANCRENNQNLHWEPPRHQLVSRQTFMAVGEPDYVPTRQGLTLGGPWEWVGEPD